MNSLFQQLNTSNPQAFSPSNMGMNQIKQMANMFRGAKNPQQLITNMMKNNPQVKQVLDMVNASGQSPKDLFYAKAKEQGVNPDDVLSQLQ